MLLSELDTKTVYLLLGSNLGNRENIISEAIVQVERKIGQIQSRSSVYETAAWGKEDQPGFLNIALEVKTTLLPLEVLDCALAIEKELGRIRHEKWGARLIDIDVILYEDQVINIENRLQIPHPEMQNRKFVMEPLAEIAGGIKHPVLNKTISELLVNLTDNLAVSKI